MISSEYFENLYVMKRDAGVREAVSKKDSLDDPWLDGRLEDDDFTTKNDIPKVLTGMRGGLIVAPQPDFFAKTLANAKEFHDSVTLSSVVYDIMGAGKKFLEFERQKNCVATALFGGLCDGLGEAFEAIDSGSDFLKLPGEKFKRVLCLIYASFELAHKWSVDNRNYNGTFESWTAKQEGFANFRLRVGTFVSLIEIALTTFNTKREQLRKDKIQENMKR